MALAECVMDYENPEVTTKPETLRITATSGRDLLHEELIARIVRHDAEAMKLFYDAMSGVIFGLIKRILSNTAEAEEVTLDVFLQVWKKADTFDPSQGNPVTWLFMIARSRAIDKLRASRRRQRHEEPLEASASSSFSSATPSPEKLAITEQHARRVRVAMKQLSPRQREAVELAYFRGLTHTELAAHTGLPLGSAKTYLRQGLIRLKFLME